METISTSIIIKLIIKGILLYVTFLLSFFFLAGVDSIYDNGLFFIFCAVELILVLLCRIFISKRDLYKITLSKYLNKE